MKRGPRLILCRARLGQQTLGKIDPFGELGELGAKQGQFLEDFG